MIKISVSGSAAKVTETVPLVAGTVGLPVVYEFDESWEGLTKTAVFCCDGQVLSHSKPEQAVLPWELLKKPGCRVYAGAFGTNSDGTVQRSTLWADLGAVEKGAAAQDSQSAAPTQPQWQQMLQKAKEELAEEIRASLRDGDEVMY